MIAKQQLLQLTPIKADFAELAVLKWFHSLLSKWQNKHCLTRHGLDCLHNEWEGKHEHSHGSKAGAVRRLEQALGVVHNGTLAVPLRTKVYPAAASPI